MTKFAANLSMMFTEVPFLERFAAAANAGFRAVEYLFPYEWDPHELKGLLDQHFLEQVLFNVYAGDWAGGEKGLAALEGREDEFRDSVHQALHYAQVLECPKLHLMAGRPPVVDDPRIRDRYVNNVRWAAEQAANAGKLLCLEPLNPYDVPGYFIPSVAKAIELITEIDRPNVKLQYDLYHAQLTDGDITHLTEKVAPLIGHVQIASVPARHEPDIGELNYPFVLAHLGEVGYDGWVGCEYIPAGNTVDGLGWMDQYRERR